MRQGSTSLLNEQWFEFVVDNGARVQEIVHLHGSFADARRRLRHRPSSLTYPAQQETLDHSQHLASNMRFGLLPGKQVKKTLQSIFEMWDNMKMPGACL